jgi:hypothetical protein
LRPSARSWPTGRSPARRVGWPASTTASRPRTSSASAVAWSAAARSATRSGRPRPPPPWAWNPASDPPAGPERRPEMRPENRTCPLFALIPFSPYPLFAPLFALSPFRPLGTTTSSSPQSHPQLMAARTNGDSGLKKLLFFAFFNGVIPKWPIYFRVCDVTMPQEGPSYETNGTQS